MKVSILKRSINKVLQIALPILLGAGILLWTYKGFDFERAWQVMGGNMEWSWMLFSFVFATSAHLFRGWRWKLALTPIGEKTTNAHCVYAVFISYAVNLVIPRIGEAWRCGILSRCDRVSFPKALGTVVVERILDAICVLLMVAFTLLIQSDAFAALFNKTGTNIGFFSELFTSTNFYISLVSIMALLILLYFLMRNLSLFTRVKTVLKKVWQGCMALKHVENLPLYLFYTVGIWGSYFLEFYVTFFCFDFSASLGWMPALVMFVAGSIAVVVPTPNGAGPWHFVVITLMMMYGVSKDDAGIFALLVHGIQTFLLILLGIYGWIALKLENKEKVDNNI